MNKFKIDGKFVKIADYRKIKVNEISNAYIAEKRQLGIEIDEYTEWFIKESFYYILGERKAYRVYAAHDVNSCRHDEAIGDMRYGTVHHMFLLDKHITVGFPTTQWMDERLSNQLTKKAMVDAICDVIINNKDYSDFVGSIGIRRDTNWECLKYEG